MYAVAGADALRNVLAIPLRKHGDAPRRLFERTNGHTKAILSRMEDITA